MVVWLVLEGFRVVWLVSPFGVFRGFFEWLVALVGGLVSVLGLLGGLVAWLGGQRRYNGLGRLRTWLGCSGWTMDKVFWVILEGSYICAILRSFFAGFSPEKRIKRAYLH